MIGAALKVAWAIWIESKKKDVRNDYFIFFH